jgi:hypothetical protein
MTSFTIRDARTRAHLMAGTTAQGEAGGKTVFDISSLLRGMEEK